MLIDIGVNLSNQRFDKDRDDVISRAKLADITAMLITGTNVEQSQQALALCQAHHTPHYLYATAGVHPHDADNVNSDYIDQLRKLAKHQHIKAIGECGLDFNRNFSTPEQQVIVFEEQIKLAVELNMPLFLHQRDAFELWYTLLKPYFSRVPAMITHCFTGNEQQLKKCLNAGMYIGITGWLCDERRGQSLRDIVKHIPLERLLVETDAPYLTPRTIRPKPKSSRNEPSYLPYIVNELSTLLNIDAEIIASQTTINAKKVFQLC